MKKELSRVFVIECVGVAMLILSVYGAGVALTIHNNASMGVIATYFDQNCTLPMQTIDWGTVIPGQTYNQTVWIRNYAGSGVNVTMVVSNWNPVNASQYMSVSWDHEGATVNPGVEQASILLTVYPNATDSGISGLSFDTTINPVW